MLTRVSLVVLTLGAAVVLLLLHHLVVVGQALVDRSKVDLVCVSLT